KGRHRRKPKASAFALGTIKTMNQLSSMFSEILKTAPQLHSFWKHLGIDALRHHNLSMAEVCQEFDLDPSTVDRLLTAMRKVSPDPPAIVVELLPLKDLCEYILVQQNRLLAELSELDKLTHRALTKYG